MPRLLPIVIALATIWALPSHADYARSFEFDVDGVRPSSEAGVTYTSGDDPEVSVVSVGSGVMHFDTVGGTGAFYCVAAPSLHLGGDLTLALRLSIADMEGPSHGGFSVLVSDGTTEYNLLFRPDGVAVNVANGIYGSGGFVAVDHSVFHTYELFAEGTTKLAGLRIDGTPRVWVAAPPESMLDEPSWCFGDFVNAVSNADTTVDFVRLEVPEPGAVEAGAAAFAALAARRASARRSARPACDR